MFLNAVRVVKRECLCTVGALTNSELAAYAGGYAWALARTVWKLFADKQIAEAPR